jgi:hypothetical protein
MRPAHLSSLAERNALVGTEAATAFELRHLEG